MDHFSKLRRQIALQLYLLSAFFVVCASGVTFGLITFFKVEPLLAVGITTIGMGLASIVLIQVLVNSTLAPVKTIWQAVLHIDPDHHGTAAPDLAKLKIGRELVTTLVLQIYQFASQQNSKELIDHRKEVIQASNVVNHMPLPLFVFNKDQLVTNASNAALEYCNLTSAELFGKTLYDNLKLEFPSENTLEHWIQDCQTNKVTDTAYWERVHVLSKDEGDIIKQCDIAAFYNKDNPSGTEFIVTMFDRTEKYAYDDESLSFVALAVHELRTPITMLRGYIEVFEDELGDKLDTELASFMKRMESSAKHLSTFVSNILNVARIDQNQLVLHLNEANWAETLKSCTVDAELRAHIHGKKITYDIASDLPNVAIDTVSMYEVINNLIENAIKYGGDSKEITIKAELNQEGTVSTTVTDFGVGIPASVLPHLFEKFSRNHRNRAQISGTGLGLFLIKSIVTAHGGRVWAQSKEGEGSTFGFTLQPYANVSSELKENNKEITRSANGWIKNHSLYRR